MNRLDLLIRAALTNGTVTPSKHGNPPNRASLNSSTRNSDRQRVREWNALLFVAARKAGTLAHQRAA